MEQNRLNAGIRKRTHPRSRHFKQELSKRLRQTIAAFPKIDSFSKTKEIEFSKPQDG